MIQLVAECWAALAAHWGCLWGTERVWGLPSRWMNGPSGRSSISGSHRPEILLADSQQSSKQWCLCADPGPLGGQNSFDSSSQRVGAQRQHMISVLLTLALVAICTFCFWCSIGKTTLVLKWNGFIYVFIYFKLHQLFQNTSFFYVTFYPHRVSWLFLLLMSTVFLWLLNGGSSWLYVTAKLATSFGLTSLLWCVFSALYFGLKRPIPLTLNPFKRKQMLSLQYCCFYLFTFTKILDTQKVFFPTV